MYVPIRKQQVALTPLKSFNKPDRFRIRYPKTAEYLGRHLTKLMLELNPERYKRPYTQAVESEGKY